MIHARLLTSPEVLDELLSALRAQGILPTSLHLTGLLGVGNNATVFSATIDGEHNIIKVYDSVGRMRRELRQLVRLLPRDRQLLSWEHHDPAGFSFFIAQMPLGHTLRTDDLNDARLSDIAAQLVGLYRLRYRQTVSMPGLYRRLLQAGPIPEQTKRLGLDWAGLQQTHHQLGATLTAKAEQFQVRKSRIHGDLWWPNIIATDTGAYLIDWDSVRRGDPAEDIAKLRLHLWFPGNSFPSRNFFWSGPQHGKRVAELMRQLVQAYEREFEPGLLSRLRFYLPLHGLNELAILHQGKSTVEPVLRPSLYRLLAADTINLASDPFAPPPDLTGTEYYQLVERSRIERLDGHPG